MIVAEDYAALSAAAAEAFAGLVEAKPDATVILPTGDTPMGMYDAIASRVRRGDLDCSRLRVFQLDEYLGLAAGDRRSLYGWMERSALTPWCVRPENVTRLSSQSDDYMAACVAYEAALDAAGGLDLCILGIGPNGHLGFNEPPVARDAPTRVVDLTPASIASNAAYWGGTDQVPRRAITAGMRVILSARQTFLLASGAHKRNILRRALTGPVTPDVPASYLQTIDGVSVYADRAAAGG
jgi:glucosamine-6-phosphate deaminase